MTVIGSVPLEARKKQEPIYIFLIILATFCFNVVVHVGVVGILLQIQQLYKQLPHKVLVGHTYTVTKTFALFFYFWGFNPAGHI